MRFVLGSSCLTGAFLALSLASASGCKGHDGTGGGEHAGGAAGGSAVIAGGDAGEGATVGGNAPTGGNVTPGGGAAGDAPATTDGGGGHGGDEDAGAAGMGAATGGVGPAGAGGATTAGSGGLSMAGAGGVSTAGAGGAAAGSGGTTTGGTTPGYAGAPSLAGAAGALAGAAGAGGAVPATEVDCGVLEPVADGLCEAVTGSEQLLIQGTILGPDVVYRGGTVAVDASGLITCVGCDCAEAGATVVRCPDGVISPGLINAREHLNYTQNDPYADTGERYEHRHDWRRGNDDHTVIDVTGGATEDQRIWGEIRQLLGGSTGMVGSGVGPGLVRNLDQASELGIDPVELDDFPLGDLAGAELTAGCAYPDPVTTSDVSGTVAFFAVVGGGIEASSHNEFVCLSQAPNDLLLPNTSLVSGVALGAADLSRLAMAGTGLIWSPRSNVTLYGNTTMVTAAARLGVQIALGTDWIRTGSMNLLRELRCADGLNRDYYDGFFSDRELWEMVTQNPALLSGVSSAIGALAPGRLADVAVFDGRDRADFRAVIEAEPSDVALVLRGGTALYGDANLAGVLDRGTTCDTLDVCGSSRFLCLADTGRTLAELTGSVGPIYPAFSCGTPVNEPTCTPARSVSVAGSTTYDGIATDADTDGDGIADDVDDCPSVFNPVRPMDGGVQADVDEDGMGDACDPCPLNADATACVHPNPDDADADGVLDVVDVCPIIPDPDQADTDQDGRGDACDPCPATPNPGALDCPLSIYSVKRGETLPGSRVAVLDALVTAQHSAGFFLQVKETDSGYDGADHSGIYVYAPGHSAAVGDRVDVTSATVELYYGRTELEDATIEITASANEALPVPVLVTPSEVATGGQRADALESVLVEVQSVTVTDVAPPAAPGDSPPINEFVVDGSLRVDDLLHLASPFPTVGDGYAAARGVLHYRLNDSKLEPRAAADLLAE